MTRLPFIAALVALLATPIWAQDGTPESRRPVKLMTVGSSETGLTRQFFGHVVARQTVDLAFQVGGQIAGFPVLEGATVPKGELVARLDPEPFELALEQAKLRKAQADRDLERLSQLSRSAVSQASQDDAGTAAELAAVAVRDAERALSKATLTAPFDALVAERLVANFSTVAAGTPVVRLHDMSELRVEVDVPEILFQRAGRDPDVDISARFPGHDERYRLEIREFSADTTSVGQTFKLTLAFDSDAAPLVLPGSSVTVSAELKGSAEGLPVPTAALVPAPDGAVSVMVYSKTGEAGGRVEARPVEVEVADDGGFLVTGGLEAGEEIVAAGATALEDGQDVRRFTGFPE